jgi:hypothetical protein
VKVLYIKKTSGDLVIANLEIYIDKKKREETVSDADDLLFTLANTTSLFTNICRPLVHF